MSRFNLNDYVRMRDVIVTSYRGHVGRIVEIKPNQRGKETLDKYIVLFPDGQTVEVWSIQLEPLREPMPAAS